MEPTIFVKGFHLETDNKEHERFFKMLVQLFPPELSKIQLSL